MDNQLERLHAAHLEILDELDRVCRENGWEYFLTSGTALGAVRHGGFIPWDDDVDVGMMREDYEQLMRRGPEVLGQNFALQTHETDRFYNRYYAKIRKRNTFFPEKRAEHLTERGIFIDIFPFDRLPENETKAIRKVKRIRRLRWITYFGISERKEKLAEENKPKKKLTPKRLLGKLPRLLFHMLPEDTWRKTYTRACTRGSKHSNRVTCYEYDRRPDKFWLYRLDGLIPTKRIAYEDREYSIMNDTDAYLTETYGDYMTPPPENERIYHLVGTINFESAEHTIPESAK